MFKSLNTILYVSTGRRKRDILSSMARTKPLSWQRGRLGRKPPRKSQKGHQTGFSSCRTCRGQGLTRRVREHLFACGYLLITHSQIYNLISSIPAEAKPVSVMMYKMMTRDAIGLETAAASTLSSMKSVQVIYSLASY